jgi:hypothetical protein
MRAFLLSLSAGALALAHTSAKLSIRVEPASLETRGDTVRVSYRVTNATTSTSELFMFTVDAPSPALRVEKPSTAPKGNFDVGTNFGRSVASWGFLKSLVPGATSPPLAFSAVGLPGIVKYWATPFVAPGVDETPDVPVPPGMPVGPGNTAADSGATVGIVPFPADRSRAALLVRLARLTTQACALGWIDNAGVCNSLLVKIRDGNDRAVVNELQPRRDKHVNASAYFLLMGNVHALPAS